MNLRLVHTIPALLVLLAAANCAPVSKSTENSTTVKQKENTCSMITTQEECLKSPCIWCEAECVSYNTSNLILGKPNNCSSTDLNYDHQKLLNPKKITKKLLWIICGLAFIGLLILCCCCCFCFGCLL